MNYSISNNQLEVKVLKKGAEICSIKSQKTGKEYIWEANPDIWARHAPVLFPIVGALKNNQCIIDGAHYTIPKHGFIKDNESAKLKNKTNDKLNLQFDYSEKTLKIFPYKFRFNICFQLKENKLIISHIVENLDSKTMLFALGAHPGFKCPFHTGEKYDDYYLEFECKENAATAFVSKEGLITKDTKQLLNDTSKLPLNTDMFNNDVLIFKELKSRKVSLKSHKSDETITIEYKDFPYLGLWAKPNAPYICIEPWIGINDYENSTGDFSKKDGIINLPASKIFKAQYSIEIKE